MILKEVNSSTFLTFWRDILSIIARQTEHIRDHLASLQTCVVVASHKGDNSQQPAETHFLFFLRIREIVQKIIVIEQHHGSLQSGLASLLFGGF